MKNFKKQINKYKSGFTLVETLVAIIIFTTSVLALMVVLSNNLSSINYAKKKLGAVFLAQEGLEYMRNIRDTYILYTPDTSNPNSPTDNAWNNFRIKTADCNSSLGKSCYFDNTTINFNDQSQPIIDVPIIECVTSCPVLRYNSATGVYDYNVINANSGFIRKIEVHDVDNSVNGDEVEVISTVYYSTPSGLKSVSLKENLFNWTQ